jgi:hypothetical protein
MRGDRVRTPDPQQNFRESGGDEGGSGFGEGAIDRCHRIVTFADGGWEADGKLGDLSIALQ